MSTPALQSILNDMANVCHYIISYVQSNESSLPANQAEGQGVCRQRGSDSTLLPPSPYPQAWFRETWPNRTGVFCTLPGKGSLPSFSTHHSVILTDCQTRAATFSLNQFPTCLWYALCWHRISCHNVFFLYLKRFVVCRCPGPLDSDVVTTEFVVKQRALGEAESK